MHNCTMRVTMLLCGHCDNSRYYHLQKGGAIAQLGQTVAAGAAIARSGNTGYSDTPHLHFDMVDLLPEDCCTLTITLAAAPAAETPVAQQSVNRTIAAVPALFSSLITAAGTGSCLLVSADSVAELPQWQQPAILLLRRSGVRTFAEDIDAALDLGQVSCSLKYLIPEAECLTVCYSVIV
jgi:Peptidase family M23